MSETSKPYQTKLSFFRRTAAPIAIAMMLPLAGLTTTSVASAQQPAATPSPQEVKKATDAFTIGVKLFQAKKFGLALEQFKKSYDTVASPNSLLYIARCQAETGALKESYRTFQQVMVEAEARPEKYGQTGASAKLEIEDLANKISVLTVNVTNAKDSTRLKVGGAIIPKEEWGKPIPLDPGPVDVLLETDGMPAVAETVNLTKSERKTLELAVAEPKKDVPPPPPPKEETSSGPSGLLIGGIIAGTIGVAGMVTFGVAGGMSLSTYSDVEDKCSTQPGGVCRSSADHETIDDGEQQQLIANVGAIVGGVGLALGATLIIVDVATGGGSSDASVEAEAGSLKLDVGPGYAGLRGTF